MNHELSKPSFEQAAKDVRLLALDVDGVLTDGRLPYGPDGPMGRSFHAVDGFGIKMAAEAGLTVAVISGLEHPAVNRRVLELGIPHYRGGCRNKAPALAELCAGLGISPRQAAFLGDDWVDAAAMKLCGLPMAVADAQPEIRDLALWVSTRVGGAGAVREAVAAILRVQGLLEPMWRAWLNRGLPTQ